MKIWIIVAFCLEIGVVALLTPLASRVAKKLGIVAHANPEVPTHTKTIALLGGMAILAGLLPVLLIAQRGDGRWRMVLLALFPVVLVGLYKDKVESPVSSLIQIGVQTLAVLPLLYGGLRLSVSGIVPVDLFLTIIASLWIMNSWNFLDVMDGLASGVATIIAALFAVIALRFGEIPLALVASSLAGCTFGFLLHNLPPAKIFLGDSGSFAIGLLFAVFTLFSSSGIRSMAACGLLLFVPLFDLVFASVARWRAGRSPVNAGAEHISLQLLNRGWSNWRVIMLAYVVTIILGSMAFAFLAGRS